MRGTVVEARRECQHAPGVSVDRMTIRPCSLRNLFHPMLCKDGPANSPRIAGSNRKELTDAVPGLGTCRMPRHSLLTP